jgi:hypothetical protein
MANEKHEIGQIKVRQVDQRQDEDGRVHQDVERFKTPQHLTYRTALSVTQNRLKMEAFEVWARTEKLSILTEKREE